MTDQNEDVGLPPAKLAVALYSGACALFGFGALTAVAVAEIRRPPPTPPVVVEVPGPTVTVYVDKPVTVTVEKIPDGYTSLPVPPPDMGWVMIHAVPGTKIYEGSRLMGVAPLVVTMKVGSHSLRAVGMQDGTKWSDSSDVEVANARRAEVTFSETNRALEILQAAQLQNAF